MKKLLVSVLVAFIFVTTIGVSSAEAVNVFDACNGQNSGAAVCEARNTDKLFGANSITRRIINVLLFVIGLISVLMVVIGGLRYVLSGGDSGAVTSAKNTILYAIVGLIVAFSAYGIVNFVVVRLL